ncbi:MAG: hypothetical protein ABJK20_17540, partial [Halieaceae bacterium]
MSRSKTYRWSSTSLTAWPGLALWFCFRCLPALLGCMLTLLVLSASVARAMEESSGGHMVFRGAADQLR